MTPLVSVITPCYNAAASLPWALGSMLAQTHDNWELIVVDDGSTDGSAEVVEAVADPRIRLIHFSGNRGRPYARQAALDAAQGKYLAMLDADDWIYPDKLTKQVEIFERFREIPVVSAGMLVLDRNDRPAGARGHGPQPDVTVLPPFRRFGRPPVSHGPTMIRMQDAKAVSYDGSLGHSEDADFLLRVMMGKPYALLGEPLYVYTEHESVTEDKILTSLACNRIIYGKYLRQFPVASRLRLVETTAKSLVYRAAFRFGLHELMIRRRSAEVSTLQMEEYATARSIVSAYVDEVVQAVEAA